MKYTLDQRVERARQLRAQGYNCAQCLLLSFDDIIEGDSRILADVSHGFGSGMGASGEICGAVTGTTMVLGLVHKDLPRPELYRHVRESVTAFDKLEGYIDCRDLKKIGGKPCIDLITDAVTLLHNRLSAQDA